MLPLSVYVLRRVNIYFELVHCDIWGPVRVTSMSGHRYYIIFIDDFSRTSWVYLLRDRSHVINVLKTFITEIKN